MDLPARRVASLPWLLASLAACHCSSTASEKRAMSDGSIADAGAGSKDAAPADATPDAPGSGDATTDATGAGFDASSDASSSTASPVHFVGRFDVTDPMAPRFAWSGSAIAATFTGTGLDVWLEDTGGNHFAVSIDGAAFKDLAVGSPGGAGATADGGTFPSFPVARGLAKDRPHTVRLVRKTEAFLGVTTFHGFVPVDGALVPTAAPARKRIEFIGDSITCGFGDLSTSSACGFSAATEDATLAYAFVASEALGADATLVAYSGKGIVRDYSGSTKDQMPVLFTRILADDPMSAWTFDPPSPDLVVIALGTNDFGKGDPGTAFQTGYTQLLADVRARYPAAHILCTSSPMMAFATRDGKALDTYVRGAVGARNDAGDTNVSVLTYQPNPDSEGLGCGNHPTVATHARLARELVTAVHAAGW